MKNKTLTASQWIFLIPAAALLITSAIFITSLYSRRSQPPAATPSRSDMEEVSDVQEPENPESTGKSESTEASQAAPPDEKQSSTAPAQRSESRLLTKGLEACGADIASLETEQIILVHGTSGSRAEVVLCEKQSNEVWRSVKGFSFQGFVGKNGISRDKSEGDKTTPAGLFPLTLAFGTHSSPDTSMKYRQITKKSYWVDDPDSKKYNQWVEGNTDADWNSAEKLSKYSRQYEYAVVIGYNQNPTVPGKGSAIFLHCGTNATVGCVAVDRDSMKSILKRLDRTKNPYILIF